MMDRVSLGSRRKSRRGPLICCWLTGGALEVSPLSALAAIDELLDAASSSLWLASGGETNKR